jgi:succinoglycan biosynthesis protein ExoA
MSPSETTWPSVSVMLPALDEADAIDICLTSISEQDYAGAIEIVAADGGSVDGTRERLVAWQTRLPSLRIIDNPHRVQSTGCNLAASAATGEFLVRMDAHTTYDPDYITRSIETIRQSGADAVGGPMVAADDHPFGRAVAAAMDSRLMAGPASYRHATKPRRVDTVYLGTFRRAEFLALGGYRSFPSNAAEDADFYHRWGAQQKAVILVDPDIRCSYRPRRTVRGLWNQYLRYGQAKAEMLWANGRFPSWRPLAPAALVLALVASIIAAALGQLEPLVLVGATWLAVIGSIAVFAPASTRRVLTAAALMHISYGLGLWLGLIRGPRPVRSMLEASTVI